MGCSCCGKSYNPPATTTVVNGVLTTPSQQQVVVPAGNRFRITRNSIPEPTPTPPPVTEPPKQ